MYQAVVGIINYILIFLYITLEHNYETMTLFCKIQVFLKNSLPYFRFNVSVHIEELLYFLNLSIIISVKYCHIYFHRKIISDQKTDLVFSTIVVATSRLFMHWFDSEPTHYHVRHNTIRKNIQFLFLHGSPHVHVYVTKSLLNKD